jgi:hypothetical protein
MELGSALYNVFILCIHLRLGLGGYGVVKCVVQCFYPWKTTKKQVKQTGHKIVFYDIKCLVHNDYSMATMVHDI